MPKWVIIHFTVFPCFILRSPKLALLSRDCFFSRTISRPISFLCEKPVHDTERRLLKQAMDSLYSSDKRICTDKSEAYSFAIKACGEAKVSVQASQLHAHLITDGCCSSIFLQNHLISLYGKCGLFSESRQVFDEIQSKNVFSWNTMIAVYSSFSRLGEASQLFDEMGERDSVSWNTLMAAYAQHNQGVETLKLFAQMLQFSSLGPDKFTFASVMKAFGCYPLLGFGQQIHSLLVKLDYERLPLVQTLLVDMYVKCDEIESAKLVFNDMLDPDAFTSNTMILGCSRLWSVEHALEFFYRMNQRDLISWNTMISILSQHGKGVECLVLLEEMVRQGWMPNGITYASALSACAGMLDLEWGKHLHARILRSGLEIDVFTGSSLIDMYAKCGSLEAAKQLFDRLLEQNAVSWTSMIGGFARFGKVEEALALFKEMLEIPVSVDQFTLATILGLCSSQGSLSLGNCIHSFTIKIGYDSSIPVANALVTMYSKCGSLQNASLLFQTIPSRDIISWTTMITVYSQMGDVEKAYGFFEKMPERSTVTWNSMLASFVQHDYCEEGLKLFIRMKREGDLKPDWITFASLFSACANLASLKLGSQVFSQTIKVGLDSHVSVANGLVTMYSKCGRVLEAHTIFNCIYNKDLVSWNSMIAGYAQHGLGSKAIELFENMLKTGTKPDYISYIAVLSGCSHSGLLSEGIHYFDSMSRYYGNLLMGSLAKSNAHVASSWKIVYVTVSIPFLTPKDIT
ncbi:hypothetical protein AMTR_s00066p00131520 [Amborella trichopoda]|uniref:Pentacotripeptide-repeat region of PRORP domain-containing protein n=1 Tax=Amborella trichopoda TaxID=13333 RepID=U5DCF0_AMBTC|nr:hypothetical protein AMTR_s00066p00131520 [Amborella trichopoda]